MIKIIHFKNVKIILLQINYFKFLLNSNIHYIIKTIILWNVVNQIKDFLTYKHTTNSYFTKICIKITRTTLDRVEIFNTSKLKLHFGTELDIMLNKEVVEQFCSTELKIWKPLR